MLLKYMIDFMKKIKIMKYWLMNRKRDIIYKYIIVPIFSIFLLFFHSIFIPFLDIEDIKEYFSKNIKLLPGVKLIIPYPELLTYEKDYSFWKELLYKPKNSKFTELDGLELY